MRRETCRDRGCPQSRAHFQAKKERKEMKNSWSRGKKKAREPSIARVNLMLLAAAGGLALQMARHRERAGG
jgi:hypothetical protein